MGEILAGVAGTAAEPARRDCQTIGSAGEEEKRLERHGREKEIYMYIDIKEED
jgi:hypothetical protein